MNPIREGEEAMKAVILCAGRGTRLRPLTHTGAKHLLPVANRPILFHVLDDLVEAGIDEVCVVVSEGAEDLRAALGHGGAWGIRLQYATQESPKGLAHAVNVTRDFVGDDPFLVYLGDNLFEKGVSEFIRKVGERRPEGAVLLAPVADPRRFGVAQLDAQGRLVAVQEKPKNPQSNLALTGVYAFTPAIFDAIAHIRPSDRGELEITDAIQHLISSGSEVATLEVDGWWLDTGMPDDVLQANQLLLEALPVEDAVDPDEVDFQVEGRVYCEPDVEVKDSLIRGPAILGRGCHIERAFIGPFSAVGANCRIVDTELENSILMPDCDIQGVPFSLDSSILGNGVVMRYIDESSARNRLVLADQSQLWLTT